jgi:hypothetical protein
MPYLLLVVVAIVAAMGFAKIGNFRKPSPVPWGPLLVWALLLAVGISIWISSTRIG